jgi:hypothetical protein
MELMDFDTYLRGKKIDEAAFKKAAPDQYQQLKSVFDQVHPDSFTAQKLFLINPIRRKYQLKTEEVPKDVKPRAARPMIRPKPKTN